MSDQWSTPNPSANEPGGFGGQPSQPPQQPYPQQPYPQQPYASPAGPAIAHAGFWIRFLGALIDGILLTVVQTILAAGAGEALGYLVTFVLGGAYFTFLHSTKAGQTIGQRVVGIRVADAATGGQVPVANALVRWLMSYVSAFAFLIGYLWMLWDPENQTWHDKVGKTYVVQASAHPPPSTSLFDR